MTKQEPNKEDKILKGIENIVTQMRDQYGHLREELTGIKSDLKGQSESLREDLTGVKSELNTVKSELGSVKVAVIETGLNVKSMAITLEKTNQKIDTAVTNHESRIRRLEEKVGV
jgi:predicted  nucleic acid-binding Zn-ribbon protein